jgi:hypothetical protein
MSGGILTIWSPYFKALSSSYVCSSISVKLKHKDSYFSFSIVNIYRPYAVRVLLWEDLKSTGVFNDPLSVISGDLNFTLFLTESVGGTPKIISTERIFSLLEKARLVDLESTKLSPT